MTEENKLKIVTYLKGKGWTSPTKIGKASTENSHSNWASPKCKELVELGFLQRNNDGWYRLNKRKMNTLKARRIFGI